MAQESYLVLARKWRPQRFEEVVGQDHITRPIQNSIRSGRIAHAYLFIGTRGVGKTTTARLLAKALNCLSSPVPTPDPCGTCENCVSIAAGNNIDVIEIDGASNNKVEDVREIRENIGMVPSSSRYKIYIIDEVHQLSASAFNALLKTLEEPPAHAVFILATTEAHKVPPTIVSRCQRYDFRRVGIAHVKELLQRILKSEGVTCSDDALHAIARAADGSIRDAESILEQVISYCGNTITYNDVFEVLGLVDWQTFHDLCDAILAKDINTLLEIVDGVVTTGKDVNQFVLDILQYFRNLLVCKTSQRVESLLALPEEEVSAMKRRADQFRLIDLIRLIEQFSELARDFHGQLGQRILLETLLIRISKVAVEISLDTVLEKLVQLGAGGISTDFINKEPLPNPNPAASRADVSPRDAATRPDVTHIASNIETNESNHSKILVTPANMTNVWAAIGHRISKTNLTLAVAMGHAVPSKIENNTLVIQFAPHHDRSFRMVEETQNRRVIEEILQSLTQNIVRVRGERSQKPLREENNEFGSTIARLGSPHLPKEVVEKALKNPHVAQIVEIFKGQIVAVRYHGEPSAEE